MALRAAGDRCETGGQRRIEQRGIRRRNFIGHDDRSDGYVGKGVEWRCQQVAQQPVPDVAHLEPPRRDIGVVERGERSDENIDLGANCRFGVTALFDDAAQGAAQQTAVGQHLAMRREQQRNILAGAVARRRPCLHVGYLPVRRIDGVGEPPRLLIDIRGVDNVIGHRGDAAVDDICRPDRDSRRDSKPRQHILGACLSGARTGSVSLHRSHR